VRNLPIAIVESIRYLRKIPVAPTPHIAGINRAKHVLSQVEGTQSTASSESFLFLCIAIQKLTPTCWSLRAACANVPVIEESLIRIFLPQRRKGAKFGRNKLQSLNPFTSSYPTFAPWRLCGRYSDFLFAFFAPFVVNYPIPNLFGCGLAALGLSSLSLAACEAKITRQQ